MSLVATCGCFDIIHDAHINLFQACRVIGDPVVVFLNSDSSIARIKGEGHPTMPFQIRAKVLSAIKYVDSVIPFDEDTPAQAIRSYVKNTGIVQPFSWVKGADARLTGLPDEEKNAVIECGGIILYYDNPSNTHTSEVRGQITHVRNILETVD